MKNFTSLIAVVFISCTNINPDTTSKERGEMMSAATTDITGINITFFGAVADGKTDNYNAFVKAAAYASTHANTTINFPVGTYYIAKYRKIKNDPIDHIYWKNCKGLKLIGEPGTVISMNGKFFRPLDNTSGGGKRSYTSGLCPFWFIYCTDVEVANLEITGNVQNTTRAQGISEATPSVTESNSIMIRFQKCSNVNVHDVYVHHAESDGILIGGERDNSGNWINSSNFTFTNVRSYNNARQGMSIGGLDNGYFKNCEFKYTGITGGTYGRNDPSAGVDIEPYITTDSKFEKGIKFEGCTFQNNWGGQFLCTAPTTTADVTLFKCLISTDQDAPSSIQGCTVLAKNTIIDSCTFKLGGRKIKLQNPAKPGSTARIINSLIEGSDCVINISYASAASDSLLIQGCQFNYTKNILTKNFISLQMRNLQFLDNKVFIPAAAIKSRPRGTHVLIQNAIISKGNKFYSEDPTIKPNVSYTGTKVVEDL